MFLLFSLTFSSTETLKKFNVTEVLLFYMCAVDPSGTGTGTGAGTGTQSHRLECTVLPALI